MSSMRPLVIAVSLVFSAQMASAQDLTTYRAYALGSTVDSVVAASKARAADVKTLHAQPATIQQLDWRAPYVSSTDKMADPVREIAFTFHNNALYQVVVTYDADRTEGMTNEDILGSLSPIYGVPTLASAKTRMDRPAQASADSAVVARWENAESLVTLVRGVYTPAYQLILVSKPAAARATTAIREAARLDAIDAPRRDAALRTKEAADASAARDKTRAANKGAFRP